MTLLRDLDRIDWTALRHAYGPAGDVPDLLRGIAEGAGPGDALDDLDVKIFHQGGFVCSAATAALPYLTAMAASPAIAVRPGVLELIGRLVHEANTPSRHGDRSHVDDGWPDAWTAALPGLLALLTDPDAAVRRELTSTLSAAAGDADTVVPALRGRWGAEDDGAARIGIVLAVGELAGGCSAASLPENAASTAATCAAVVASSQLMPTVSASTRSRFTPRAAAASTLASAPAGTRTRSVSKKESCSTWKPRVRSPSASRAVCPCTRSAISRSPYGPW